MTPLANTPRADGYRMPGEFEAHARCWMAWPERPDNWRNAAAPAQHAFAAVAAAIARFEPVTVCASPTQMANARAQLPPHIAVAQVPADDSWMRDIGPTFVVDDRGAGRGVDWQFNAWGGLYSPCEQDKQMARRVLTLAGAERYECGMVMEGGAIHADGEGTLLTTEECLLNPNRNPGLSREQTEGTLRDYTGAEKIVWLGPGLYMDRDTGGHVDNLCCFVRPGHVALAWTDDPTDPQRPISLDAFNRLSAATDARGRRLTVHKVPMPHPQTIRADEVQRPEGGGLHPNRGAGGRMAASYLNFYIANGGIVMPGFGDPHDEPARQAIQSLFPEREVVQVYSREILLGGGNIHCTTQQQPLFR